MSSVHQENGSLGVFFHLMSKHVLNAKITPAHPDVPSPHISHKPQPPALPAKNSMLDVLLQPFPICDRWPILIILPQVKKSLFCPDFPIWLQQDYDMGVAVLNLAVSQSLQWAECIFAQCEYFLCLCR